MGITRDNAPNITKAFDEGQFKGSFNFPCACHSLNLMFNEIYKTFEPVSSIVKQADKMRMLFANSNERRKLLASEQEKIGLSQIVFPSPIVTRWWSLHQVLVFIMNNHQAISNAFANPKLFKRDEIYNYSIEFLSIICALNHLGGEVFETSTMLESDSQPTISLILPFLFNFSKKLDSTETEKVILKTEILCKVHFSVVSKEEVRENVALVFKAFKKSFSAFKAKYLHTEFYERLAVSTLLDPRYV